MIRHAFLKDHHNNDIKGKLMVGDTRIRSTSYDAATVLQARKTESRS